jgi:peptidoglycan hydrolase-like protein with peptidoglycan-binding domain
MVCAAVLVALVVLAVVVARSSGASLAPDGSGLARIEIGRFGGTLTRDYAVTPRGRRVPLVRHGQVLTPTVQLPAGQRVQVVATVQRPGWLGWALGEQRREQLAVTTPVADVAARWVQAQPDGSVRVAFTGAVARVSYLIGHQPSVRRLARPRAAVGIGRQGPAGTLRIAASARPWERLGANERVTWFPPSRDPVAIVHPRPGGLRGPAEPITLTFSAPIADVLHGRRPTLSPSTPGRWSRPDSHTLVFTPAGYGTGFGTAVRLAFGRRLAVAGADGRNLTQAGEVRWTGQPGSTLRLQQLLAQAGYLPLDWTPTGAPVPATRAAQSRAAFAAPAGTFGWRYANTPGELKRLWTPGRVDVITRGAIMAFQDRHGLAVDAIAGAGVWKALLDDTVAGRRRPGGYSYVSVHRDLPQRLILWHDGHTVLTSPGNTGVPAAPTELGTFPVFEHLAVTTMSGTNPDGSHYVDPGIKWVSYFNGGDALHSFPRASFGTPQSLGCVELPLATAARVWPHTPIGTLVTVEH